MPAFDPAESGLTAEQYGGHYIDSGGHKVVNVVSDAAPGSAGEITRPAGYSLVRYVRYSLADLKAIKDEVTSRFEELNDAGVGVSSAAVDVIENQVVIGVAASDDIAEFSADPQYATRVADGAYRLDVVGSFVPLAGTRNDDRSPWYGGAGWWPAGSGCTSNFVFYKRFSDGSKAYRIVTAGHCNRTGAVTTRAGNTVGTSKVIGYANYSAADSMHVVPSTGTTTNRIWTSTTSSTAVSSFNSDPPVDASYNYCYSVLATNRYCSMRLYLKNQDVYQSDRRITILDQDVFQQRTATAAQGTREPRSTR